MPAEILVTRDILAEDTVFVVQCLRENARGGRSTHMMDIRQELANSVTLEVSDYIKFLRKHEYVTLDRERHTLDLTPAGQQLAAADPGAPLLAQLADFFADKLRQGTVEVATEEEERQNLEKLAGGPVAKPPPPPDDATPAPGPLPAGVLFSAPGATLPNGIPGGAFSQVLAGAGRTTPLTEEELAYTRGDSIGQGPLATVYRSRHGGLGLDVAVKEVRESSVAARSLPAAVLARRLQSELSAQARLRHPCIVALHDVDLLAPQPYVVMELCEGGNLRDRLKAAPQGLPPAVALRAFGQILSALAHAHAAKALHLNLKPENVLFDAAGNVKLADFGLTRLVPNPGLGDGRFVVDAANLSYLAPELLQPGAAPNTQADVYAAGIVFYEMVTGRVPGRRSPLPSRAVMGIPPEFDELFDRMTADVPGERHADAGEAQLELQSAFPDGRYGEAGQVRLLLPEHPQKA